MALPPIVTNSALYRVLSGTQDKVQKPAAGDSAEKAQAARDTVSLSEAALKKLDGLKKTASIDTPDKARQVAGDVRTALLDAPDFSLANGKLQDL